MHFCFYFSFSNNNNNNNNFFLKYQSQQILAALAVLAPPTNVDGSVNASLRGTVGGYLNGSLAVREECPTKTPHALYFMKKDPSGSPSPKPCKARDRVLASWSFLSGSMHDPRERHKY